MTMKVNGISLHIVQLKVTVFMNKSLFFPPKIGGEYAGNEFVRPYFGFPRISRAGSRLYSKLGEGSQETIKRGGPGGGAGMWFGPRLGRMQKRSPSKEHV